MGNVKTTMVFGIATALSSIVHSEILDEGNNPNVKPRRSTTVIGRTGEAAVPIRIPEVSGNGVRGIGRRLLFEHTFAQLGVAISELFPKEVIARRVQSSLRAGGVTPAGMTAEGVSPAKYKALRDAVPIIGALGMVFHAHQFEGSVKMGGLLPYLKETAYFFDSFFPQELTNRLENITISHQDFIKDAHLQKTRYTRRGEVGAIEGNEVDADLGVEKEAMIYGVEYIPAGTIMGTSSRVTTDNEGARLAFLAMNGLIMQNGIVGGMSGKGHGFVQFELYAAEEGDEADTLLNPATAISKYDDYLQEHKEEIIEALKGMPELFGYVSKAAKTKRQEKEKEPTKEA